MTATNASLAETAKTLHQTATRLQRVGLIVDRRALSPHHRRAAFVLQCRAVQRSDHEPTRPPIGFAYPTVGKPAQPGVSTVLTSSAASREGRFTNEIAM
jgi:hypothetical protein